MLQIFNPTCRLPRPRAALAALLLVALLFAQWAGLQHRIAHAGWLSFQPAATAQFDGGESAQHSCAAFDAATLADNIHTVALRTPLLTSAPVLGLWIAFASWDAPLTRYFSSRAPPLC